MTVAVCIRVTFRLVHVVIETHTHSIPVVLKDVCGASSLATRKADWDVEGFKHSTSAVQEMHFDQK